MQMDAACLEYMNNVLESSHSNGYVSYTDLYEHFENFSLEKAKNQLITYAETVGENYQKLYDVSWMNKETNQYLKKMLDEDEWLLFLSNSEGFEIIDVELHMIAKSNTEFCNYLNLREGPELLSILKGGKYNIERKSVNSSAHKTDKKANAANTTDRKIDQKPTTNSAIYRKWGIAGTENIANRYFKKSDANEKVESQTKFDSKITSKPIISKAKEEKIENKSEVLGKKRKFNEIEQKLEDNLVISEPNKRSKIVNEAKSDKNWVQFDPNLYSVEESSEELPIAQAKPHIQKEIKTKGRKRKISDEEMEVENQPDHQNISAKSNIQMDVKEDIKKAPIKLTRKVKKWRTYQDEDGFECKSEYSSYEEYEVENHTKNQTKSKPHIETKASVYRAPENNQKTLKNYFTKGNH